MWCIHAYSIMSPWYHGHLTLRLVSPMERNNSGHNVHTMLASQDQIDNYN